MIPSKKHETRTESRRAPAGADESKARSMAAQSHQDMPSLVMWESLEQLPDEDCVHPEKPHCKPLRMHFGLAVKMGSLYEYSFKRRLVPAKWRDDEDREYAVFEAAVKELDRLCGTKLYMELPLGTDCELMVARYNNYTWYYEELEPEEEEEVMDIIRNELGVHDSPRWYHGSRP